MWLEIFFQELKERGQWDNTVIAIISDHGEDLLDHGVFNHRAGLWDSTTHVPMIIWGPGVPALHIDQTVSTIDLGATLLGAVGLDETRFPGNDWLNHPPSPRPPVVSEGIGLTPVTR